MTTDLLKLALPKGRMKDGVFGLLADAGVRVRETARGYRPSINLDGVDAKILKPQNTVQMLASGLRDLGFAGADWVAELDLDHELVEVLDTGMDAVRIVAAAPAAVLDNGKLPSTPLRIASELKGLTEAWIAKRNVGDTFIRTYGATEVFPPEDADCIVDITQTGATLEANGLVITDELMRSSTRLYASKDAWANEAKRAKIESIALLVRGVLEARSRVMLDLNVSEADLDAVIAKLPCMREPTVAKLQSGSGYAVRAAIPKGELNAVVPTLKSVGATDIVVTQPSQIVP